MRCNAFLVGIAHLFRLESSLVPYEEEEGEEGREEGGGEGRSRHLYYFSGAAWAPSSTTLITLTTLTAIIAQ